MMNAEESFHHLLDLFAFADELPRTAIETAAHDWNVLDMGRRCRALLHGFVTGEDLSERTERAMSIILHLLAEKADTASFPDICALGMDTDRLHSGLGDVGADFSYSVILANTFGGDPAPLFTLIDCATANDGARTDGLLLIPYFVATKRLPERQAYDYLAGLPPRLDVSEGGHAWLAYADAVATLGFAGLSAPVERAISEGLIPPSHMSSADFWSDVRAAQQDPGLLAERDWSDYAPIPSAADFLAGVDNEDNTGDFMPSDAPEPVRNPLRNVGRNDPCPCGSGKKYKKCCLAS